jgi:hypothetical protein
MAFYPDDAVVPSGLQTTSFIFRMLRATDVALDYAAVLASRESLLLRSAGRWPREGFTLAENLLDLQRHEREHVARLKFTFTVMNPAETECLGAVYIKPLKSLLQGFHATPDVIAAVATPAAYVTFWVRPECAAVDLDQQLLAVLIAWFKDDWVFATIVFLINQHQERQIELFRDAGLHLRYAFQVPIEPYRFYLYGS